LKWAGGALAGSSSCSKRATVASGQ
jgi:hypothetical protein